MTSRAIQTAIASLLLAAPVFGAPSARVVVNSGSDQLLSWQIDHVELSGIAPEVEASLNAYMQKKTRINLAVGMRRAELRSEAYDGPGEPVWSLIVDTNVAYLSDDLISVVETSRFSQKNDSRAGVRTRTKTYRFDLSSGAPIYDTDLLRPNAQERLATLLHETLKDASPYHPLIERNEVGDYTDNVEIRSDGMVFHLDGTTPPLKFSYDTLRPFLHTRGPLAQLVKRATTGTPLPAKPGNTEDYLGRLNREAVAASGSLSPAHYALIRADNDWFDAHDVDALLHMLDSAGLGDLREVVAGVVSRARDGRQPSELRAARAYEAGSIVASLRNAAAEKEWIASQSAEPTTTHDSQDPSVGVAEQVRSR